MKVTFKQFLEGQTNAAPLHGKSSISSQAIKIAADFLDSQPDEIEKVDAETEDKVLDVGKEISKKSIDVAGGNIMVRLFKAFSKAFARIEDSEGHRTMYKAPEK